jgi:uncharacterized protein (TIGR03435 family)
VSYSPSAWIILLLPAIPAMSQDAVNAARQFEVVSVKPSKPGVEARDARYSFPPGRMELLNVTVSDVLGVLNKFTGRVEGGAAWVQSDRYDIVAKADGVIAPAERLPMIVGLLQDRFKLAMHHESRVESGLILGVGKKAPNLTPAKEGEETSINGDLSRVTLRAVNTARLANYLHQICHTTVVDRTHLAGLFDFSLDLEGIKRELPAGSWRNFSDLVRAALEQFGFVVDPQDVPVDVTVIDRVERPSEN